MSRINRQPDTYFICLPTGNLPVRPMVDTVMAKRMFGDIEENAP